MIRYLRPDILVFTVLSVGLHLVFVPLPERVGGAEAMGDQGTEIVTLVAAETAYADLVAEWEDLSPPEVATETAEPTATPQDLPPVATSGPDPTTSRVRPAALSIPVLPEMQFGAKTAPVDIAPKAVKPVRTPKAAPASRAKASVAQKAAGKGGGHAKGQNAVAQSATLSTGTSKKALAQWGGQIRAAIERKKRYPAAGGGARGAVGLQLVVARSGRLQTVGITKSSGSRVLDNAAIAAVRRAGQFKAAPKALQKASYRFNLTMSFKP